MASDGSEPRDGVMVAMVGYICRSCETPKQVGRSPTESDDGLLICPVNQRLYHGHCETCDGDRTHVIDVPSADRARDKAPIEGLVR